MTLLAPQQIGITGTNVSFAAAAAGGGDTLVWDEHLVLEVKNTDGSSKDVTLAIPGTTFGQNNPDVVVTVPATSGHMRIGPIPKEAVNPATGPVNVTYSAATGVTVALTRV